MKQVLSILAVHVIVFTPMLALAQGTSGQGFGGVSTFFSNVIGLINNTLIPLVFALALLMFFYGIFKYFIVGGGDEGSRQEGRQLMLYAIIGFVLMAGIYGIIQVVTGGLGIDGEDAPDLPTIGPQGDGGFSGRSR